MLRFSLSSKVQIAGYVAIASVSMVSAAAVKGSIQTISPTGLAQGVAYDPDRPTSPLRVLLYVDCSPASSPTPCVATETLTNGVTRQFTFQIPTRWNDQRQHRLYAKGIDLTKPTKDSKVLVPTAGFPFRLYSPPTGSLEGVDASSNGTPGAGVAQGRATDPDGGPIVVKLLVDCLDPAAPGCVAAQASSDPTTGGFRATIPAQFDDGAIHTVRAHAVDHPGNLPGTMLPGTAYYRWHPNARVLGAVPLRTNLRYFGFYGTADFNEEPGQPPIGPRNMLETMYSSNLVFMTEGGTALGQSDLPAKLSLARAMGQNVMLDVTWEFWCRSTNGTAQGDDDFWTTVGCDPARPTWPAFADRIASWSDVIVGFYLMDEPYHTSPGRSRTELLGEMRAAATAVKDRFPEAAVATVFSWTTLYESMTGGPTLEFPDNFDWIGFDCYGGFDQCGDGPAVVPRRLKPIRDYAIHLKSKFHAGRNQKMILVPQSGQTANWSEALAVDLADDYYDLAFVPSSPVQMDVVAIGAFLWQTRASGLEQHWDGTRDLPAAKERFQRMGFDILPRTNQEPIGDLNGFAGTILRGWALDPDTPMESSLVEIRIDGIVHPLRADARRVNVNRGLNVGGKHGIEFEIPCELQDDRLHVVDLHGVDTSTGLAGPSVASIQFRLPPSLPPGQACP